MKIVSSEELRVTIDSSPQGLREFGELWESKYPAYRITGIGRKEESLVVMLYNEKDIQ